MTSKKLHHLEKMIKATLEEIIEEAEVIKEGGNAEKSAQLIVAIANDFLSSMDTDGELIFEEESTVEEKPASDSSSVRFAVGSTVIVVDRHQIYERSDSIYNRFSTADPKPTFSLKSAIYNGVPAEILEQIDIGGSTPSYLIKCCGSFFVIRASGLREFHFTCASYHHDCEFEIGEKVLFTGSALIACEELFEQFNITDASLFPKYPSIHYGTAVIIDRNLNPFSGPRICYVVEVDKIRFFVTSDYLEEL